MGAQASVKALKRAALSVYRFGPVSGTRTFLGLAAGRGVVQARLPGYPAPILVRKGESDSQTFEKVFLDQEYNFDLPGFHPRLIVDGGANVGYATVFFARKFPDARILSVEPEPANFEMLKRNTAAYPQVTPIQAALWNRPADLVVANPEDESWAFRMQDSPGGSGLRVRSLTVCELLEQAGAGRIDLLKLDIEGSEKDLFASGTEDWLGNVGILIIELHDRLQPDCSRTVYQALVRYPFGQFPQGENIVVVMRP
jgi:FkbM family methyltransferase